MDEVMVIMNKYNTVVQAERDKAHAFNVTLLEQLNAGCSTKWLRCVCVCQMLSAVRMS
jgi:hypothetical protein